MLSCPPPLPLSPPQIHPSGAKALFGGWFPAAGVLWDEGAAALGARGPLLVMGGGLLIGTFCFSGGLQGSLLIGGGEERPPLWPRALFFFWGGSQGGSCTCAWGSQLGKARGFLREICP